MGGGRVLKATRSVMDKARDLTEKKIEQMTAGDAMDRLVAQALQSSGDASTSAPASSASTPGP